jgi:hypothetical protein
MVGESFKLALIHMRLVKGKLVPEFFQSFMSKRIQGMEYFKNYFDLLILEHESFNKHAIKLEMFLARLSTDVMKVKCLNQIYLQNSVNMLAIESPNKTFSRYTSNWNPFRRSRLYQTKTEESLRHFIGIVSYSRDTENYIMTNKNQKCHLEYSECLCISLETRHPR